MFDQLLIAIGRALDAASIPYMVIGGQAVLIYGEPRLTRGIDVTIGIDASGLDRLLIIVRTLGLEPGVADPTSFVRQTNVLPVADPGSGLRVDFIFSFTPYESAAINRAVQKSLEGFPVRFAAVEDVIIHKLFAGRPRDLEDVRGILRRHHAMDDRYLETWLPQFTEVGGRDLWKEFVALRGESASP